ncbi:MAG: orotidine-5'-phosphate decarboxylase [Bacteroidia bacterium]|nr:MAG: orotidine-5'-phosphate decarboxylase [Bacteroidia bacterium]PIE86212.1 MAG: orotidine-5'-phosphate decarboxylase [Bacteroidia bacterium]
MNRNALIEQIRKKESFLCVGLDTLTEKIPACMQANADPVFAFNKEIIDATAQYSIAFKPNLAFYESNGLEGWQSLEKTVKYIRKKYPDIFIIADAKRGDIGNTSAMYAKAFFETLDFDALTIAPYMGKDSVVPFLQYKGKWVILLALTSNPGAFDFQFTEEAASKTRLFEKVINAANSWAGPDSMMYVVGATKSDYIAEVRRLAPENFLLVPGVGAQGGNLQETAKFGMNKHCGLIVNSSRGIIYADSTEKFAEMAAQKAKEIQAEMKTLLHQYSALF